MKCYKCNYEWEYKGAGKFALSCPKCSRRLIISKIKRLEKEAEQK